MLQLTPKQWQEMMELDTVLVKVHDIWRIRTFNWNHTDPLDNYTFGIDWLLGIKH